ncbi:hypothetical protein FOZ63_026528 [Perkinsus olseni]|uniref:Uncharacterized protein n=2 Tax=Perkinsus olseni TaxID=32597 RepID=A0A7J6UMK7_PEROL|nr:hypothetical protein FOZ63_026528 [Perkinsus olseni]
MTACHGWWYPVLMSSMILLAVSDFHRELGLPGGFSEGKVRMAILNSQSQVLGVRQGVQEGIRYYLPACELPENDEVRHIVDGIGKLVGMDCKFDRFLASTRCHDSSLELGVPGGHVWLAVLRVSDDSLLGDALNSGEPKQKPCYFDWIEAVELVRRSGVRPDGVAWRLYTLIQDYAVHGVGGLNMELRCDLTNSKAQIVLC